MLIKGLLYDLDDTLISRDDAFLGFTKKFFNKFINPADYSYSDFLGFMRKSDSLTKWSAEKNLLFEELRKFVPLPESTDNYVNFFWDSIVKSVTPDERSNNHLKKLNSLSISWGVVTNGFEYQREKLKKSGVGELAPFTMISGEFGCHKPCKEIFYAAANKLELNCENILFVGDTAETDIVGAKSVGMKTAWVKMGRQYPNKQDLPDFEIDHVADLENLLTLF
ncbi:MAG: hypothetical protein CL506_03665 [Actinobacteria bacterium]|nr:hypothetical protein [Actinomycetota bacterium]